MSLPKYMIEGWIEFAVGVTVTILRVFARTWNVGLWNWRGDDYLIIFALANYTIQLVMHQGIYENGMNWALTDDFIVKMTDEEVRRREQGSLQNFIAWVVYLNLIWSLKFCMLFFYWRFASSITDQKKLKICGIFIFLTYIGSWMVLLFHCKPIQKNWQVRPSPGKCSYELPLFYVVGPLNIVTDIVLLFIPIPLINRACLNWKRKLLVGLLLCGGIFIIVATTLNNLFSMLYTYDNMFGLLNHKLSYPNSDAGWILGWGVRETFTAMVVVNLPCIKPLFSRQAWIRNKDIVECQNIRNKTKDIGSAPIILNGPKISGETVIDVTTQAERNFTSEITSKYESYGSEYNGRVSSDVEAAPAYYEIRDGATQREIMKVNGIGSAM